MRGSTNAETLNQPYIRCQGQTADVTAQTLTTVKYSDIKNDPDTYEYNTSTGAITVKKGGAYLITMSFSGQMMDAGILQIGFKWNDTSQYFYAHHYQEETLNNFVYQTSKIDQLSVGDIITPQIWGTANLKVSTAGRASYFSMIYLGKTYN